MALNEEIRRQRKKLKGKGIKAHLQWFWDYEKVPTLLVAVAAAVAVSLIVNWVTYRPDTFGVLFINAAVTDPEQEENLSADFMDYAGIDAEQYDVFTDLSENIPLENSTADQSAMLSQEKILAELSAGEIDMAVMDLVNFNSYLASGMFTDLADTLDAELLDRYGSRIYYVDRPVLKEMEERRDAKADEEMSAASDTVSYDEWQRQQEEQTEALKEAESSDRFELPDSSSMEDPVAVGIMVNDAPYFQQHHSYDGTVAVLGITGSGKHPEYCGAFLEYLYEK